MPKTLFREAVLKQQLYKNLGVISLNSPLSYQLIAYFSGLLLIALCLFLFFGKMSTKVMVRGFLDAKEGNSVIYATRPGIILHSTLVEGKLVNKGDTLLVLGQFSSMQNDIIEQNLAEQLSNLNKEYALKKRLYQANKTLYAKGFISRQRLDELRAETIELHNKINLAKLAQLRFQQNHQQIIKAPISGRVTNILAKQGQMIKPAASLLEILPPNPSLIAKLYLPIKAHHLVKKGDTALLYYDAYPYQRFGAYPAEISDINLNSLTDAKEDKPLQIGEPYYQLTAKLKKPYLELPGQKIALSQGLTFSAKIAGEPYPLWQWLFTPFYNYYQKL